MPSKKELERRKTLLEEQERIEKKELREREREIQRGKQTETLQGEIDQLSKEAKAAEPQVKAAREKVERLRRDTNTLENELAGKKQITEEAVQRNPDLKPEYDRVKRQRRQLRDSKAALQEAEKEFARQNGPQQDRYLKIRDKKSEIKKLQPESDMKPTERGRANEAKALKEEGLKKNNKKFSAYDPTERKWEDTIPDGLRDNGQTVDIKDVAELAQTQQLRLQRDLSWRTCKCKAVIVTGEHTYVPDEMQKLYEIHRKTYLGPQKWRWNIPTYNFNCSLESNSTMGRPWSNSLFFWGSVTIFFSLTSAVATNPSSRLRCLHWTAMRPGLPFRAESSGFAVQRHLLRFMVRSPI
jgi:hypothetical protein